MKPKLCTKPHTQENRRQRLCRKSELADRVFLNRYLAIPVFLMILRGIFYSTFEIADRFLTQPLAQLIHHLTDLLSLELAGSGIPFWIHELIIHGICAGVGSILSFLPTIATLFFFLSLLEHSGYMDRVARILDLPMNRIGLPGRAILPLVTGFGCSVPAILAAGMLPSRRDQRLTIAMIPFLSCSAKLPIYLILTQVFFPNHRVLAMLSIYLTGILLAICCALILSRTRFRTSLPPATWGMTPYQIPRMKTVLRDVLQNSLGFVRKAFTVILIASAVIWILQNFTPTLTMTSDSRESILACLGRFLSPLFAPLGLDDWRAVSAILTGLSAKESVAGTLSILAQTTAGGSVPRLLCEVFTPASACSFLVFCLLYVPCIASLTAIRKTCGKWRYAVYTALFQTAVAWGMGVVVYQVGRIVVGML